MKTNSVIIKCQAVAPEGRLPRAKIENFSLGQGYISGNVIANKAPKENMIVELFDSSSNLVRRTRTDIMGRYIFEGIDHTQPHDVVVYDESREWEKKVSSRRYPLSKFNSSTEPLSFAGCYGSLETDLIIHRQLDLSASEGSAVFLNFLGLNKHNRIYINTSFNNTHVALIELEFMLNGNVIPPVGGTVLKSSELNNDQYSANNAFDGITLASTYRIWATTAYSIPAFIGYSFPEAVAVDQFRIWPRDNTYIGQSPKEFIFQTSSDGTTWKNESYSFIFENNWNENTPKVFSLNQNNKLYWGIVINSRYSSAWQVITELEMYENLDDVNLCKGGTGISNSYDSFTWNPNKAFDGVKTGYQGWCSENSRAGTLLLAYNFGKETQVNHIKVLANNTDSSFNFKQATVVSSSDGITWIPEWEIPEQPAWGLSEERVFSRP